MGRHCRRTPRRRAGVVGGRALAIAAAAIDRRDVADRERGRHICKSERGRLVRSGRAPRPRGGVAGRDAQRLRWGGPRSVAVDSSRRRVRRRGDRLDHLRRIGEPARHAAARGDDVARAAARGDQQRLRLGDRPAELRAAVASARVRPAPLRAGDGGRGAGRAGRRGAVALDLPAVARLCRLHVDHLSLHRIAGMKGTDMTHIPEAERWTAEEVVAWGLTEFGDTLSLASSFGAEDVVIIDLAASIRPRFNVFTLDTDFLFPETYALIDRIEARYGVAVERLRSAFTPEEQARVVGEALWRTQPDVCCNLRKVEPLSRKQIGRA